MKSLPPWAIGPFELIVHGEIHFRSASDFDRRIALISFDNALEVSITTYLTLHPLLRGGRTFADKDVKQWTKSYHSKLDFFENEIVTRKIPRIVDRAHVIWAHDNRNEQYHGGNKGTPEFSVLEVARTAALWVFSVLFDVDNADEVLEQGVLDRLPPTPPSQVEDVDEAIDELYGTIDVGEQSYYASEVLFAVDYTAYRDIGTKLTEDSLDGVVDGTQT